MNAIEHSSVTLSLYEALGFCSEDGIVFGVGQDKKASIFVENNDLTRHVLAVDPGEAGKNALLNFALAQQIGRGGGAIIVDSAEDTSMLDMLNRIARNTNRHKDLLVVNPFCPELSNTYNTILSGSPEIVATQAMTTLPATENNPGADYYRERAIHGIVTIVAALKQADLAYSFLDLVMFVFKPDALERLLAFSKEKHPTSEVTRGLDEFLSHFRVDDGPIETSSLKSTFGGIAGRLYMFSTGRMAQVLNSYNPDVDLQGAILENKIVYIAAPGGATDHVATALRKMIFIDLQDALSKIQAKKKNERSSDVPFMVALCDATVTDAPQLVKIFEMPRSVGISTWLCARSMEELSAISAGHDEIVMSHTWSKAIFNHDGSEEAKEFSALIGDRLNEHGKAVRIMPQQDLENLLPEEFVLVMPGRPVRRGFAPLIELSKDPSDTFSRTNLNRSFGPNRNGADVFTRTDMI